VAACGVGSGGSSTSPQAGAFILPHEDSRDFDLEIPKDVPDRFETTDDVDSMESRLEVCPDGRLGGRIGHGWDDCRLGSGGGAGFVRSPFCTMRGGGSSSAFVPFGRLPIGISSAELFLCPGGLMTDSRCCNIMGVLGEIRGFGRVGGGSPGTRLIWEAFKAAIRC
jgi:hypothetical protein